MREVEIDQEGVFPHKEITEVTIGSAFDVYNQLGYGYLHRVYQNSLGVELGRRGRDSDLEKRIKLVTRMCPLDTTMPT